MTLFYLFCLPGNEHPQRPTEITGEQRIERRIALHERIQLLHQRLVGRNGLVELRHLAGQDFGGDVRQFESSGLVQIRRGLHGDQGQQFGEDVRKAKAETVFKRLDSFGKKLRNLRKIFIF